MKNSNYNFERIIKECKNILNNNFDNENKNNISKYLSLRNSLDGQLFKDLDCINKKVDNINERKLILNLKEKILKTEQQIKVK